MTDLTDRQTQILRVIVEEYTATAEPVGSETLDKKHNLGVSPATIRNEMAYLTKQGYLKQPHTSAGRVPTPQAIKLYISELMREKDLSVTEEVSAKETIWEKRHELGNLLRQATKELARRTNSIGVAVTDDARLYHAGYAHILDLPEFYDIDITRNLLTVLDEAAQMIRIFDQAVGEDSIHVLVGDEIGGQFFEPVSTIFADFKVGDRTGRIGIIGSCRVDYSYVIPLVRHFGQLITNLTTA